eukprot:685827-Amphidinium_carterae.1
MERPDKSVLGRDGCKTCKPWISTMEITTNILIALAQDVKPILMFASHSSSSRVRLVSLCPTTSVDN